MKTLVAIAALGLCGGCIVPLTPEQQKTHVAPIAALPEIIEGATLFRLVKGRWPQTKEELEAGAQRGKKPPEYLSEIQTISIVEQSSSSILYRCVFRSGGSTEVRVNLSVKDPDNMLGLK
jgi:hypothetical protein